MSAYCLSRSLCLSNLTFRTVPQPHTRMLHSKTVKPTVSQTYIHMPTHTQGLTLTVSHSHSLTVTHGLRLLADSADRIRVCCLHSLPPTQVGIRGSPTALHPFHQKHRVALRPSQPWATCRPPSYSTGSEMRTKRIFTCPAGAYLDELGGPS